MANGNTPVQMTKGEAAVLRAYQQALPGASRQLTALFEGHTGLYGSQGFAGVHPILTYFEHMMGRASAVIETTERGIELLCRESTDARMYRSRRDDLGALKFAAREVQLRQLREVSPHAAYLRALWLDGEKPDPIVMEHYNAIPMVVEREVLVKDKAGKTAEATRKVAERPVLEYLVALRALRGMRERLGERFTYSLDAHDHLDQPYVNDKLKGLKEEMLARMAKSEEARQVAVLTDRVKEQRATAFREGTLALITIGLMTTPAEIAIQNCFIPEDSLLGDSAQLSSALKETYDSFVQRLIFCGKIGIPVAREAMREAELHLVHILQPMDPILGKSNFDAAAEFLTTPVSTVASAEATEGDGTDE